MEWLFLLGNIAAWCVTTVAALLVIGFVYQSIAEKRGNRLPPGELITISGRAMHLLCLGEQRGPTVILEAGGSNSSITSRKLQADISKFARVCAYDRAGYGFSEPASQNRTFDKISEDLDSLLVSADIAPPYILIGESMGGLMARNYYRLHPEKVAGVLLLDAAEEEHTFGKLDKLKRMQSTAATTSWLARIGLVRLLLKLFPDKAGIPHEVSSERRQEIIAEYSRPEFFSSAACELDAYFSAPRTMHKPRGFGSLGSTPLIVVTHGKPLTGSQAFLEKGWRDAQIRLASLSTDSSLIVAEQSGHAISLDQPELVVKLTRTLVEKARSTTADSPVKAPK